MIDYLIRGIKFPFQFNSAGGVATSTDEQHIKEAVHQIVITRQGSLPFKPTFGSRIPDRIFDPTNAGSLIQGDAREALETWEQRIENLQVTLTDPAAIGIGRVEFLVRYRVKGRRRLEELLVTQGISL